MEYRVRWEVDVDAESPKAAAREALRIQRDADSQATVFKVFLAKGTWVEVDLLDE